MISFICLVIYRGLAPISSAEEGRRTSARGDPGRPSTVGPLVSIEMESSAGVTGCPATCTTRCSLCERLHGYNVSVSNESPDNVGTCCGDVSFRRDGRQSVTRTMSTRSEHARGASSVVRWATLVAVLLLVFANGAAADADAAAAAPDDVKFPTTGRSTNNTKDGGECF